MDLKVSGAVPSAAERIAIDTHVAAHGTARDQLLPLLHAIHDRVVPDHHLRDLLPHRAVVRLEDLGCRLGFRGTCNRGSLRHGANGNPVAAG